MRLHPGLEVAAQQAIHVELNVKIRTPAKKLQVHFLLKLLDPSLDRVLDEMKVLLFGVAERAVRQVLQEHWRQAVNARHLFNAETLQFNQLHVLWR